MNLLCYVHNWWTLIWVSLSLSHIFAFHFFLFINVWGVSLNKLMAWRDYLLMSFCWTSMLYDLSFLNYLPSSTASASACTISVSHVTFNRLTSATSMLWHLNYQSQRVWVCFVCFSPLAVSKPLNQCKRGLGPSDIHGIVPPLPFKEQV